MERIVNEDGWQSSLRKYTSFNFIQHIYVKNKFTMALLMMLDYYSKNNLNPNSKKIQVHLKYVRRILHTDQNS